jgi:hypothetical protein
VTGFDAALHYLSRGFSVVALAPGTKRPVSAWADYQRRRLSEAEAQTWWRACADAGVAIVCGGISGVVVLDIDPRHGGEASLARFAVPEAPEVRTGGGGRHLYFALEGRERVTKLTGLLRGVDLQGEGALAIAPPSIHPNGQRYVWVPGRRLGEVPLPPIPNWLRRLMRERELRQTPPVSSGLAHVSLKLEHVLTHLDSIRRSGRGWTARCPAHDDRVPSLAIGLGERGQVLLYCHAGCSYPAIWAALMQLGTA